MNTWYSQWFNKLYLRLYSHRDAGEAQQQINFLLSRIAPSLILDVACGSGRHVRAFEERGLTAFGIDRSLDLLVAGRVLSKLACADMRQLPFADSSFDLVTSFFTSFGYFESDSEHQKLLFEWRRVLRSGGNLFIDYLNPDFLAQNLVPHSNRQEGSLLITEKRRISSKKTRVIKDIVINDTATNHEFTYTESVRLYSAESMRALLTTAGFNSIELFGDFKDTAFDDNSSRMLLLCST